jgi:hypothetical protein
MSQTGNPQSFGAIQTQFVNATRAQPQAAGLATLDSILYDTVNESRGNAVALDIATGIFTLQPGFQYELAGGPGRVTFSGVTGILQFEWRSITGTAVRNSAGIVYPLNGTAGVFSGQANSTFVTPVIQTETTVEMQFKTATAVTAISVDAAFAWAIIKTI